MSADKKRPTERPERAPTPIKKLYVSTPGSGEGILLPGAIGMTRREHIVEAGQHGDVKTAIEHLPWLRVFRVTRTRLVRDGGRETWAPLGDVHQIPDTWAVSVPDV